MGAMKLPAAWRGALDAATAAQLRGIEERLAAEGGDVFPPAEARYRALELVAPEAVKVVILGQDPYHGPGQAMGLAFSVPQGVRIPPSLGNIFKELRSDLGIPPPTHGDLTRWARQGVLLLNTSLSVRGGEPASHAEHGWSAIADALLRYASRTAPPSAFLLWGKHAQARRGAIDALRHRVLEAGHPSPLSARHFLGSRHFSKANAFLRERGRDPIDWGAAR
jgi:uracil-DNA glycosylase